MKARPSSTDIPVSRADLLDAQGKYDAAIAEYRAILSRQPNNILAANNLAWLLAIAWSTVAIRQHVVLDAVAGAALGTLFAALSIWLSPRVGRGEPG